MAKRRLAWVTTGTISMAILAVGPPMQPLAARAATTTTYTATETIPVPPASNYAGAGGGDGWSIALSNTQVFNIFHHNGVTQLSCHNQSDASACYPVRIITDGSANNFATSGHPGMFLDQNTGKLYTYGTRGSDSTAGVICIDTTLAATNPNPFCGYTALTAVNDGPLSSGISGLSTPMQVGTKWYAFNFVNGTAAGAGAGGQNTLLCFDLATFAACAGQPIPVNIGAGTIGVNSFPTPATAGIGAQIVIPIVTGGNPLLACWDASTGTNCSGSWPTAAPINYAGNAGAPFAELDPTGKLIGLCLPTGTDQCYSLMGASVATPPGMTAAIGSGSVSWDGGGLVLGPRVYVPAWNNVVYCYDSSTSASCANFPKSFNNLSLLYTVNPDPHRPTCIWVNSDGGSAQIQNFDAYSGGACGAGPIRVLASSIVVPTQLCTPFTYTSLQVLSPAPSSYTSGTVAFEDPDGNPIAGTPVLTLDATGTVSLTGLSLNTALGLPEFLITLTGASTRPTSVTVRLTWTGVSDPSCIPSGGSTYVAMGDSYSSGEGAHYPSPPGCSASVYQDTASPPTGAPGTPTDTDHLTYLSHDPDFPNLVLCGPDPSATGNVCHRANTAYSHVVETSLASKGLQLKFIACSGAVIQDFYQAYDLDAAHHPEQSSQHIGEIAQIDQLKAIESANNVRLITLTISGNDVDFAKIAGACAAGVLPFGDEADCLANDHVGLCKLLYGGTPLAKNYGCYYDPPTDNQPIGISVPGQTSNPTNVHDALIQLLHDLHAAAPAARILIVGYPRWFPVGGTAAWGLDSVCSLFPQLDQNWINSRIDLLNQTIRDAVAQSQVAEYVPDDFTGHEICPSNSGNPPWLNPLDVVAHQISNSPELLHPNPDGHRSGFAPAVVDTYLAPPATVGATGIPQVVTASQIQAPPTIKACGVCFGGDTINLKVARSTATSVTPVKQYKWYDQTGNLLNCAPNSSMCDHALVKDVTGCDHDYILETDGVNGSSAFWVIRYETVGGVGGLFSTCKVQQWSIDPGAPVQ